jgi:hypothetical protein
VIYVAVALIVVVLGVLTRFLVLAWLERETPPQPWQFATWDDYAAAFDAWAARAKARRG